MKKILFGCIAAASMLFAASCAKESEKALPGEALEVTFDVSLQSALSTRAISDGNTVDKLTYKVYNTAGEAISGKEGTADIANGSASVKISLIQGQTYQFVFWAQKGDTYDLSAFPTVKVDYTNVPNNDESRDAFYFAGDIKIEETTQTVKLNRPFAQINFGVIYDKEVPVTKSSMTVNSGVYSQIDLLTGNVTEEVKDITFTTAAIPTETLKANGKEYTYLSMDYVLVPKEGSTLDLSFDFDGTSYKNANVPAKKNHRTNLLAEVTAEQEIDFNITVDPNYDEEGDTDIIIEGEGNGEEPGGEEPGETKEVVDVLNNANTINSTATSYTTWTYTATSGAEYSGNSAGQYSSIQLRTTNSNEGVVTTKSGGKVAKISVKWISNTLDARTLDVYGKNEAYESPADLFNPDKQGNLIASFAKADGDKEIVIEGNPTFIGFRSNASALYLDEVKITWIQGDSSTEPEEPEEPATVTVSNVKAEYAEGKVNFTANFDGKKEDIKSAAFVYGPATRAASEGEVAATIGDGVLTASTTLEPGNYTVSVKINGEPVESTTAGQDEVNIEVPESEEPEQPGDDEKGSLNNPFTVAEAIAKAIETNETPTTDKYYIKGFVASITEQFGANFGNATFTMVDKGSSDVFTAFRVFYQAESQKWVEGDEIVHVGDEVLVCGQIVNYKGNTPETNQNTGYLVEILGYAPVIDTFEVDYNADTNKATFTATYTNKDNVSLKAGFTYEGASGSVDVPATAANGTFTATIDTKDLAYGTYNVIAYVNDIKSSPKAFTIKDPNAGEVKEYVDVLDNAFTGVGSVTQYKDWENTGSASGAVYKGQSAGDGGTIQLRSNNNNSGIVTTASGGTVKKIVVTWNTEKTANGRKIDIYGKNDAYSAATDLYGTDKGTQLGSIVYSTGTSTGELVIEGNYTHIGFRSNSSALYLDEVQITWEK